MQTRPFLRTSSKSQLFPSCLQESHEVKATPQHVVIGFHLVSEESDHQGNACDHNSRRSVLESGAHYGSTNPEQLRSPRSPRSVLGCLFSGQEFHRPPKEDVGLGVVAPMKAEEAPASEPSLNSSMMSIPIVTSARNEIASGGSFAADSCSIHGEAMRVDEFEDFDVDEPHVTPMHESIFCAASPFSACCSLEYPACDFLSVCFFCKCSLLHGKDVYMYKGDKAFCSSECRYQQIIIDEFKERQLASANCYVGTSTRKMEMFAGASAAVS